MHPFIRRRLTVMDVPLGDYIDALEVSESLRREMAAFFLRFDLLLTPVCSAVAFEHGHSDMQIDDKTVDARHSLRAAVPWDITGHPALAVPFAMSTNNLPIGVQLVGRKFEERLICKAGVALQRASPVVGRHPDCAWAEPDAMTIPAEVGARTLENLGRES